MNGNQREIAWEDLHEQTRKRFGCEKHRTVKIQDAMSHWICPVCLIEETTSPEPTDPRIGYWMWVRNLTVIGLIALFIGLLVGVGIRLALVVF